MTPRIHLAVPPNIARSATDDIRTAFPQATILPPRTHDEMDHYFSAVFGNPKETADLTVAAYPSAVARALSPPFRQHFEHMPRDLPAMRPELADAGMGEPDPLIKVIGVVTLLIIHHRDVVPAPAGWADLCREGIADRVVIPPANTPAPAIYSHTMARLFGDKGRRAVKKVHACLFPQDINQAVDAGDYKAGMVFPAFARTFRHGGAKRVWPREGAIPIPLVALLKKGAPETARNILRYLLEEKFQAFLSQNGLFCPVRPDIPLFKEMRENRARLAWPGWQDYLGLGRQAVRP